MRLIKVDHIINFKLLGHGDDPLDTKKCHIDLNALRAREDAAIRYMICFFHVFSIALFFYSNLFPSENVRCLNG